MCESIICYHDEQIYIIINRLTRDGTAEPSGETKLSGANGDREIFIFRTQLTTNRVGNLRPLLMLLKK